MSLGPLDISTDYLTFDFLISVEYYSKNGDDSWDGPYTINNCSLFDSLPTYDGTDAYYRPSGLNMPIAEWFDTSVIPKRGDKVTITESQETSAVARSYSIMQADFDQRLQIWRFQLLTQQL